MRSFVIMSALVLILAGCTKSSRGDKGKATASATPNALSSAGSSSASDDQPYVRLSRRLDEIELAEYLKRAVKSAGVSTLSSSAFDSVCPSALRSLQETENCLYVLDKNDVFQLCFPAKEKKYVFTMKKEPNLTDGQVKAGAGHLIWKSGEDLFVWDGTNVRSVSDAGYVSSFLISPNGHCLAWNTNWRTGYPGEDEGRFPDSENKENIVYTSSIGSQVRQEVYWQEYTVDNIGSDNREEKKLLAWSKVNPSILYLTMRFERQLYDGYQGIKAIDFTSGEEKILGDIEYFLAFSPDEKNVAYTPNDHTCCGGSNYTNNTVIISDTESDRSLTVYDEWKEFGNEGKEEEYVPFKAAFSPDGSRIAISISGSKSLVTIRKIDGGGDPVTLTHRFVIGWLDQDTLILAERAKTDYRQGEKVEDIYVYNLKNRSEESLSLKNVTYLAFE